MIILLFNRSTRAKRPIGGATLALAMDYFMRFFALSKIKKKLKTIGGVTTDGTAAITGVIVKNGKVLKAHVEV